MNLLETLWNFQRWCPDFKTRLLISDKLWSKVSKILLWKFILYSEVKLLTKFETIGDSIAVSSFLYKKPYWKENKISG